MLTAGVLIAVISETQEESVEPSAVLSTKLQAIKTFRADFTQFTVGDFGKNEDEQSGYMVFEQPSRFLWVVNDPFEQHLLIEDTKLTIYDPDLSQVTYTRFDPASHTSVANLLLADSREALKQFDVVSFSKRDTMTTSFRLTPKEANAIFARITIYFHGEKLEAVEVMDHFDTVTEFNLANIEINVELKEDDFTIEIPEGTEVLMQGKFDESDDE